MFAMIFKCFSGIFVSASDVCFKYSIYLLLYVATIASCFKSRSGVTHGIRVGSGWRRGLTADALPCKHNALCTRLLPLRASVQTLASRRDVWAVVTFNLRLTNYRSSVSIPPSAPTASSIFPDAYGFNSTKHTRNSPKWTAVSRPEFLRTDRFPCEADGVFFP
jgi:hypothetical protein